MSDVGGDAAHVAANAAAPIRSKGRYMGALDTPGSAVALIYVSAIDCRTAFGVLAISARQTALIAITAPTWIPYLVSALRSRKVVMSQDGGVLWYIISIALISLVVAALLLGAFGPNLATIVTVRIWRSSFTVRTRVAPQRVPARCNGFCSFRLLRWGSAACPDTAVGCAPLGDGHYSRRRFPRPAQTQTHLGVPLYFPVTSGPLFRHIRRPLHDLGTAGQSGVNLALALRRRLLQHSVCWADYV